MYVEETPSLVILHSKSAISMIHPVTAGVFLQQCQKLIGGKGREFHSFSSNNYHL